MRTTLDLPDNILRRTKIEALKRGSTLRQLVIDASQREVSGPQRPRKRLARPPIKLAAEDLERSEASKACALHR